MIKFSIPGQPQGKARAKVTTIGGFARAYTPEKTAAYENQIRLCFKGEYSVEPLEMEIIAYYQLPKSMPKYKQIKALCGDIRPTVKPDIDNVIKVICDALNGVAYKDDTQIVSVKAEKYYANVPRVEVIIIALKANED